MILLILTLNLKIARSKKGKPQNKDLNNSYFEAYFSVKNG